MSHRAEKDDPMAERTCIVTRDVLDPDDLVRFVAGPDGRIIPDLKRKLPGRGCWVTAHHSIVEQAVAKKAFARSLKRQVVVDADLADQVDALMAAAALASLGFARKAGDCMTGATQVRSLLEAGKAITVLHASDAAADGQRKLSQLTAAIAAATDREIQEYALFDSGQLSLALGGTHVIHAALKWGGAARNAQRHLAQLAAYRQNTADRRQNDKMTGL